MRLSALAALCACALGTSAAPVPKHLMPKEEPFFYPTTVGAKHVSIWSGQELVEVVAKVDKTEGGFVVHMERVQSDGTKKPSETVIVTARGLVRTHSGGKPLEKPCELLVLPHGESNTWLSNWGAQKRTLKTAGWEEIEVPAGKFRAMRVDHYTTEGANVDSTHWYAPGIGCVKWYSNSGKVGRPMQSFTPGK